jgi:hypothetical protein
MKTKWLADNVIAFEPEGAADNMACVTSDQLRDSGWSEAVIEYVERYRFGSAELQLYEEQMVAQADLAPDSGDVSASAPES